MIESELVAIAELADELQVRKQRIFKLLPRLGIRTTQRRDPDRGNQNVAVVTRGDAILIRGELERATAGVSGIRGLGSSVGASSSDDIGFFYLIELEPDHDPGRFKVGFTMDLDGRMQKHRCSAPFAKYLSSWPCRRGWERAAIDCCTAGVDQLHTEVFRARSLREVEQRASEFFRVMPALVSDPDADEADLASDESSGGG